MKSEQIKFIVVVVLLVGAGAIWYFFGRSQSTIPDGLRFVDIKTGEQFSISRQKAGSFMPVKNPKTGERTLLPISVGDDGKTYVSERHGPSVLSDPKYAEVNRYVDPQTLEVLSQPRQ